MAEIREPKPWEDALLRAVEIVGGLVAIGVSVVVLANPLVSASTLIALLAVALASDALQLFLTGGTRLAWWRRLGRGIGSWFDWAGRLGRIVIGLGALAFVVAVLLEPGLRELTLLYLLAGGVLLTSLERLFRIAGRESSRWLRGFSFLVGAVAILLIVVAATDPSVGLATFAILVAVSLLLEGVQSVVSGLRPSDPRQIVLLQLILFSLIYGLVLINWIDLFGKSVPGYGVWLVFTYFAPFWMILIYEGFSEWPLALSLGLLVSLANDVGYYFVGNLLFGFHQNLGPWIAGQLGLYGTRLVTVFQAGVVAIPVDSWLMGLSIYARAVLVIVGLYYWWTHPARIVARLPTPGTGIA